MWRVAILLLLLTVSPVLAADLPPGALARLGDDRFRAGTSIDSVSLSPDGKQFVTVRDAPPGRALTVWDATTGQLLREHKVNSDLLKAVVWGPEGGFAILVRAEPRKDGKAAQLFPDDFRVWNFTDPKAPSPPMLLVNGPTGTVAAERVARKAEYTTFCASADGRRVAALWKSAEGKHAVHVFELAATDTAEKLARVGTIDLGAEGADILHISANGETLLTFRILANSEPEECTATVWNVSTGKPSKPVRVPWRSANGVTPDARSLIVLADDGKEWGFDAFDLSTGKRRVLIRWKDALDRDVKGELDVWCVIAFSSDNATLLATIDYKTHAIDLATGKERARLEGHATAVCSIAVSTGGDLIATADANGLVRLWNAKTLRPISEALGHRAQVEHAELSPDGKRLLTWAWDETVRLWDVTTGKELRAFTDVPLLPWNTHRDHNRPTFTPDGTAILYSTKARLISRDLQTGLEVPLPGEMAKGKARYVVFAPDGKAVLTWGLTDDRFALEVWDWPSGKKRASWTTAASGIVPGFTPDGSAIFQQANSSVLWDAKTGKELPTLEKTGNNAMLSLRPYPSWAIEYGDGEKKEARVIEAGTGKHVSQFRFAGKTSALQVFEPLALSPRGGQFASSTVISFGWTVHDDLWLYESATGTKRHKLVGHRGGVRVLGFTPDGTKLLTAGGDHTVLVWDMRLAHVPLPEAVKKETDAAKLWSTLATGNAKDAYLAMARLAREPDAAVRMAKLKLKPVAKAGGETDSSKLTDARAIELLEALDTDDSRALLKELAAGHADAFRTQEAKRALERNTR